MTALQTIGLLLIIFALGKELYDVKRKLLRLEVDLLQLRARVAQGW